MFDDEDGLGDVEEKDGLCFACATYDELTIEDEGDYLQIMHVRIGRRNV